MLRLTAATREAFRWSLGFDAVLANGEEAASIFETPGLQQRHSGPHISSFRARTRNPEARSANPVKSIHIDGS